MNYEKDKIIEEQKKEITQLKEKLKYTSLLQDKIKKLKRNKILDLVSRMYSYENITSSHAFDKFKEYGIELGNVFTDKYFNCEDIGDNTDVFSSILIDELKNMYNNVLYFDYLLIINDDSVDDEYNLGHLMEIAFLTYEKGGKSYESLNQSKHMMNHILDSLDQRYTLKNMLISKNISQKIVNKIYKFTFKRILDDEEFQID